MSFQAKTDFVGLETAAKGALKLRSNALNASNSVLQIPGSDGSIIGDENYGSIAAPTCDYAIVKKSALSGLYLGKVYDTQREERYALQSLTYTTGAGQEPTFSATAVQIELSATQTVCTYAVDELSVETTRHAQTFGAFEYGEAVSCALQSSTFTAQCDISPATINGEPVASDSTAGLETVAVTFWSASDTVAPDVTTKVGWRQTADWTCTGADAAMFVWTATFTKYLKAVAAQG